MIHRLLSFVLAAAMCGPLLAADVKPIKWSDLQPDSSALRSAVGNLNQEQKARLMRAFQQRQQKAIVAAGKLKPADLSIDINTLLKEDFSDLEPLVAKIEAFEKKRTTEAQIGLDKQTVQLDGYLLPLKQANKKVTEFILVPVIGACIHVPAPPANQMVVVQYPKGFPAGNLFAPITVTGKLLVKSSKSDLALADGSSKVEVGYAMTANEVREYQASK
ncbi:MULTISPECIES: DUF3299 domain-containing protein [unclassified Iodobacter]|uniref:DUF3299 domain-containing protein n=1 Tax=unclassified Iodobacter TaxID=235634 RepID=UPI0025E3DC41|nr:MULTISPECIES: DUF3299 domain-containing protein [unclassified Iodobacter]MDW5417061.1 DUF3299 domain-containing protein [Iodobacter sp. CM08]